MLASLSMGVLLPFPTIHGSFNRKYLTFSYSRKFSPAKDSRFTAWYFAWVDQTLRLFYSRHTAHFFGSHDQCSTARGESHDQYRTLLIWCFQVCQVTPNSLPYFASYLLGWHLSGFCQWIQIGWRHRAAALTSFLRLLSVSNNFLITWFSIPSWIHPRKNY